MRKRWCHDHKTTGKAHVIWSDESSFTLFPTSGRDYNWRAPTEAYNSKCPVPEVKHRSGSVMVWAAISWYGILLVIITFHGRITARECVDRLGNQVHPMTQSLFPNSDAVFQDDSATSHTAGSVQS
jgi:hypothetical protein